jgi:hypothetical protein
MKMNRQRARAFLEAKFPGLRGTKWRVTSPMASRYNCLAWAVGEKHRRWDLHLPHFWPQGVPKRRGIAYLVAAYRAVGFVDVPASQCQQYDPTCDTVVLYELNGSWEHAARLLHNGMWSSKMGDLHDIQHPSPHCLQGIEYGTPFVYMKRRRHHGQGTP